MNSKIMAFPTANEEQDKLQPQTFPPALPLLTAVLIGGGGILTLAHNGNTSAAQALNAIVDAFYSPGKNFILVQSFLGRDLYEWIYLFWGLTLAGVLICALIFFNRRLAKELGRAVFLTTAAIFILTTALQTAGQFRVHLNLVRRMAGKTTEEKIALYFPKTLAFARYCQRNFPGKHIGRGKSDLDMNNPQHMLTFFAAAYYLYPIDIRVHRGQPTDCLVIFLKDDPLQAVEPGFVPLVPFDDKSLLAIKLP